VKLLLTGSTGFVGQAVLRQLGNLPYYEVAAAARHRASLEAPNLRCVPVPDLSAQTDWSEALSGAQAVLHLAGRAHVMRELACDPLAEFRATNTAATLHLARQAALAGVRRFVFVSSVKVHGERTAPSRPFDERMVPMPVDAYAISKHEAEQGLRVLAAETGMDVVIVRPPLVYGPGAKANFAALAQAIARGRTLPLGAIDNRRSLVAVDNLVDLLLACLQHPRAANECFLVSDGEDLSSAELARRLGAAIGRPARLLRVPAALLRAGASLIGRGDAARRLCDNLQVDITKARTLLGWTPPISVDEGLRRAVRGMQP
jgi:nucleoside-diphosphate-sugar epimerase